MAKAKQARLDGMPGGTNLPDVSKAAELYVEVRDERMALTKREVETRTLLIGKMRGHSIIEYKDPDSDLVVTLVEGKTKVKVKRAGEDDEESEEETDAA